MTRSLLAVLVATVLVGQTLPHNFTDPLVYIDFKSLLFRFVLVTVLVSISLGFISKPKSDDTAL